MKILIWIAMLGITVSGCALSKKVDNNKELVKVVKATVREHVPGIEGGAHLFSFYFKFEFAEKGIVPESIIYNGQFAKLQEDGKGGFTARLSIPYEVMRNAKAGNFDRKKVSITINYPDRAGIPFVITDLEILETQYQP